MPAKPSITYNSDKSDKPIQGDAVSLIIEVKGVGTRYLYLSQDEFDKFDEDYGWTAGDKNPPSGATSSPTTGTTKKPRKKTPYQRLDDSERERVVGWLVKNKNRPEKQQGQPKGKDTEEACTALGITIPE